MDEKYAYEQKTKNETDGTVDTGGQQRRQSANTESGVAVERWLN